MTNKYIFCVILFSILSGPAGHAGEAPKTIGDLHAFSREALISTPDCGKTYKLNFDTQAECKVELWAQDFEEVILQPLPLIGLWQYRDDDFKLTVTFTREPKGYSVRLDSNDKKFKDRLQFVVAQKYIASAIQQKKFERYTTLVARPSQQMKAGGGFKETYKGLVQVYMREVNIAGQFAQKCREGWDGIKCSLSLVRNTRGETLFTDVAPATYTSGRLTLQIKSYSAWKDGTAFSLLNIQLRANRFERDLNVLAADLAGVSRQIAKFEFKTSQIAGDLATGAVYSQRLMGNLRLVSQPIHLDIEACRANYRYMAGQFKGRCEVKRSWPGFIAQPNTVLMEFFNINNLGSFVTVALTPAAWRIDFSGDEKSIGKFSSIEPHLNAAVAKIASTPPRLFLTH